LVSPWFTVTPAAGTVIVTVVLGAPGGTLAVTVTVQLPLGGIVSPLTVAVPEVAGNALKTTLPPVPPVLHEITALLSENEAPAVAVILYAPPVRVAAVGLVMVKLCVVVGWSGRSSAWTS